MQLEEKSGITSYNRAGKIRISYSLQFLWVPGCKPKGTIDSPLFVHLFVHLFVSSPRLSGKPNVDAFN